MNNSDLQQLDLSGLCRDDLLTLIAAQKSQLQSQQQQQQQQQSALASSSWLRQQQQQQQLPSGLANSLLHDPLLPSSLGGNASASSLAAALLRGGAAAAKPGMADLLLRSQLAAGAGVDFHHQDPTATAASAASELHNARARLDAAAAAVADPYSSTMRNIMLRNSGGGYAASGNIFPGSGSTEDVILRGLVAKAEQERAAALAGEQQHINGLAAASGTLGLAAAANMSNNNERLLSIASLLQARNAARLPSHHQQLAPVDPLPPARNEASAALPPSKPAAASRNRGGKPGKAAKKTKRPLSAYNIFFKEEHATIIAHNLKEKAEKEARGESISSDDDYEDDPDAPEGETRKRKRSLSTNQPGKRGKRQVDFENLTKAIGKRWKELPSERVDAYKRRAEEAMQAYRKNLFQKIRKSVKEDQAS